VKLLEAVAYYHDHGDVLGAALDEMVTEAQPQSGDDPAVTFATLVSALARDRSKAVTVAAVALMRLAEIKSAAERGAES